MDIRYFSQINRQYQRMPDPLANNYKNQDYRLHLRPAHSVKGGGQTPIEYMGFKNVLNQTLNEFLAPPIKQVINGDLLKLGHEGQAVKDVKQLLKDNGYPVNDSKHFDRDTAHYIGRFQIKHGLTSTDSPYLGKVGPSTLNKLEEEAKWGKYDSNLGNKLASYAHSHRSGGRGKCYAYVARAVHAKTKPFLQGYHAYMAADHLAKNKDFKEIQMPAKQLDELPAGAVVVWSKGRSRSGHISISDGKGYEISDHRSQQMKSHYGGGTHRVFIPVKSKA